MEIELNTVMMMMMMMMMMMIFVEGNRDTNEVYDPCMDSKIQRSEGFSFGIALSSNESFFSNGTQLSPCDNRLPIYHGKAAVFAVFRPMVDEISLLNVSSSDLDPLVEQEIEYEWLPVKCNHCKGYGHLIADCKKKDKPLDKETGQMAVVITAGNKKIEGQEEGNQVHAVGVEISATIAEENTANGVDKAAAIAAGNGEKSDALAAETVVAGTVVLAASNAEEGRKKRTIKAPNVAWQAPKHKGSGSTKRAEVEKQRVLRNSFELLGENQREEIGEEGPFFSC